MKITLKHITKSYGDNPVLTDISLVFESGRFTTLLGPSGCGKTTLLRIIAGLEIPDEGEIYFDDTCIFSSSSRLCTPPEKRGLGFVFQDFALWPHMTVFENTAFGLRARGRTKGLEEQVMQALSDVRLTGFEDRYPHQLSGGQQQRVAFARAISIHPSCILFDEPFSALDAGLREEMRSEVRSLVSQKNITSIFVTHDQLEAMEISDSIIVLDNGRILQQGRPEDIYCSPSRKEVAGFVGHANWLDDSSMVRPENIRIDELHTPGPDYVYMKLPVTSVQFLGEHYEVQVMNGRFPWRIPARQKYTPGTEISLSINRNHIIHF